MSEQNLEHITALIRQTRNNIIGRLEEEVCCEGGCADPYCKAIAHAIEIIKGNVDYPGTSECLYCYEIYEPKDHATCPNCAVNTDTKGITIIKLDKEEK